MADSMEFDPKQGAGYAFVASRLSGTQRPGRPHRGEKRMDDASDGVDEKPERAGDNVPTDDPQSPTNMFEEALSGADHGPGTKGERVASPAHGPSAGAIAKAAESYKSAMSRSGGVTVTALDAAKREFPNLTNPKALEAFVAYHTSRPELAPKEVRDDVERRLRDGVDASGMAAAIRELTRVIADLKTISSISSMASVAQLAYWYEGEMGRSGVPLSEWLGLSDALFEISGELSSQSSQYSVSLGPSDRVGHVVFGSHLLAPRVPWRADGEHGDEGACHETADMCHVGDALGEEEPVDEVYADEADDPCQGARERLPRVRAEGARAMRLGERDRIGSDYGKHRT